MSPAQPPSSPSLLRPIAAGYALIVGTVGAFGATAAIVTVSGAVVAPGVVAVESGSKPVQHPDGGVVAEILVSDGDEVQAGDVLVRLDDVQTRANLGVLEEQLVKQRAILTRLRAERDLGPLPERPDAPTASENAASAAEAAQFQSRRRNLDLERSILQQKIGQYELVVRGHEAEIEAITATHRIAASEHASLKPLIERGITPLTKGLALEREIAGLVGRKGQRLADVAKTLDQISETRLQLLKVSADFEAQVLREIAEAEARIRELSETQLIAKDKLGRVNLRSPQGGVVQNVSVYSAGAVIKASEPIMSIVPKDDRLVIDARVAPDQIDRVSVGQAVKVRFTNFNRRLTPELDAHVILVPPDLTVADRRASTTSAQATAAAGLPAHYAVRVQIRDGELAKLGGAGLLPGMLVETLISTEARSILSYLLKPLTDRMALAFRER